MNIQEFIFSEKRNDRIKQHLLFWGIWYPYITLTHAASPFGYPEMAYFRNPVYTFTESFFVVLAQVPLTYGMLYFVLPKFILRKKYLQGLFVIIAFWFAGGIFNLYLMGQVFPPLLAYLLPTEYLPLAPRSEGVSFFMAVIATNKGAFTIACSALMLKFGKHWYHKEHRNLQLQKENAESQLRLLTAQVHPHFLFNTLNNIYSQTQIESPKGSKMIMGLSDILRYILYEGQKPMVRLKQELQLIIEYVNLEKIRYGNKLEVNVLIPDTPKDLYIAPLLLLPFVENCFKHGTSNVLENPWINLTIELKDTTLVMKLMNGKVPMKGKEQKRSGIGINNVRKRLDLLYKDRYDLQIREEEEVFVVDLRVELIRITKKKQIEEMNEPQNPVYA
ncbi:sensor histidine kinase [Cognataquiflexum rubidum]|uniref:sensor histidine kinase n=1 Tax=Cognataquiflexum rubidum TaxID=2922273 RepID=UPI001F14386A|nr:histidine kinase [Cognataquiflexum rubidum]MCH6236184.1 histidine kinase [Cognataquiflexum rubidum]